MDYSSSAVYVGALYMAMVSMMFVLRVSASARMTRTTLCVCGRGGGLDAGAAAGLDSATFNAEMSVFITMKVAMATATMMTVILVMTGTLWAMDESEYDVEGDDRCDFIL